ncbi:UPF0547 protein C16orf87 homolog isoform X2 [Strongylocentrotus purpuratus]|uniref:UPF0547 domain-containing protein n=1 Tax=Strongylocentrotus purpuratus TaxID=7668 RepID=A0A7M7N481_STRPU|nr:UPF0547 protein C16orf87 homolog isoform X2 [Strongylocentrotus purpuratus]XP_030831687.1 UPF0547 protein C16orf87 homolog isoform X2 [Strongylocentrotus purpuratus]|eukprot:XP_011668269.1 PREDICTED: UPF0547 protein C16orf87 homolog isoform X2 [Strongylocentrotus purpuratus]
MGKVTKNKMVVKHCPNCENQVPVACKECRCGHAFFTKKLLHSHSGGGEGVSVAGEGAAGAGGGTCMEDSSGVKRRRTERVRRERPDYYSASEFENHLRRISTSKSGEKGEDKSSKKKKHRRGRPKGSQNKSIEEIEEEREKDLYSNLPTEKAFVYAVVLAEINEKLQTQSQEWKPPTDLHLKKRSKKT